MKAYLDILDNIMSNCTDVRNNRTGIPDIGLAGGAVFEHNMADGFPNNNKKNGTEKYRHRTGILFTRHYR